MHMEESYTHPSTMFTFACMHLHMHTQCIPVHRHAYTFTCVVCTDDNIHKCTYALTSTEVKNTHTGHHPCMTHLWLGSTCHQRRCHITLCDSTESSSVAWGRVVQTPQTELEMKIQCSLGLLSRRRRRKSYAALVGLCRKKVVAAAACNPSPGASLLPLQGPMSTPPSLEQETGARSK